MSANLPDDDRKSDSLSPKTLDKTSYARPSDRIFRRSRAARARRAKADKSDVKAIAMILQLCVLVALVLVCVGVAAQSGLAGREGTGLAQALSGWASPWLGPLSKLEASGMALITLLSAVLLWRWRRRG